MKPAATLAIILLALVALLHVVRLLFGVAVTIDGAAVPMWASVAAVVGSGALAVWLWYEQRTPDSR